MSYTGAARIADTPCFPQYTASLILVLLACGLIHKRKTMAKEENLPVFMDVTTDMSYHERMVLEPFYDIAPFTAENFRALCTGEKGVSEIKEPMSICVM